MISKRTKNNKRNFYMPSIIKKFQKCGKKNCHCNINDTFHGPYYWLVKYVKPRNSLKKGKYKWQYISKNPEDIKGFINSNKHLNLKFDLDKLNNDS